MAQLKGILLLEFNYINCENSNILLENPAAIHDAKTSAKNESVLEPD